MSAILIPVLRGSLICGWPKYDKGGFARYTSVSEVMTTCFRTDAHFAQYNNPEITRRLGKECLTKEHLSQLGGAVRMVLVVFDADTPDHGDPTSEWLEAERIKIERLSAEHPRTFVYFTRHGYRLVALLPEQFLIRTSRDANVWTTFYHRSCAYIKRAFDIKVDPIGDWQRLFRAPHATRDEGGQPEHLPRIGDPSAIGIWEPKITPADAEAAKLLGKQPPKAKPPRKTSEAGDYHGKGVIGRLLSEDHLLGDEIEAGMWAINCPLEPEHSDKKSSNRSTVYYEPSSFGHYLGTIECLHESHGHHRKTSKDWLHCWPQARIDSAREAEGLPAFNPPKPPVVKTEGAAPPIDFDEPEDPTGPNGGTPVIYVSLELEATQVYTRIIATRAKISWSKIWLGRYSDNELARINIEAEKLRGKPFKVIEGNAGGWSSSNLHEIVEKARASRPQGPLFIVLDFLQLVGANVGERVELREKIGKAAYVAKQLAREFGVAILLISSTARDKYSLLCSAMQEAGLSTLPGEFGGICKTILRPQILVGLGKESGEIEFAADSVTVISKWPTRLEGGDTLLVLSVPKLRYGRESWCVLVAHGGTQLSEFPCESIDELPEVAEKRGGKAPVPEEDLVERIIESVAKNPGKLRSANDIVKVTVGNNGKLYDAIKIARRDGLLSVGSDGSFTIQEKH